MENEEKVLTKVLVEELGLDKLEVITSDMIDGYTRIGDYAFAYCSGLTLVTIPNSVTNIGDYAFAYCSGLNAVVIPNSVTSIGTEAFAYCNGLTSVIIPNSVTSIGAWAFYNTAWLANQSDGVIYINQSLYTYKGEMPANTSISVLDGTTQICGGAFYYCSGLTSITIPNSVTSIGDCAFRGCSGLISVIIPNSVTIIGEDAFCGCTSLTSITIPNSATSIGYSAFDSCSSITSITIPNSIKCIEKYAFYNCNKLKNVVIGDNVYKKHKIIKNKCKAYKAFNADLTCRYFQYKEGKTYEIDGEPELCKQGFHACLSLTDVFIYYYGDLGKEIVVHEVELEGVSNERHEFDSKVVAKKITIGKRIL